MKGVNRVLPPIRRVTSEDIETPTVNTGYPLSRLSVMGPDRVHRVGNSKLLLSCSPLCESGGVFTNLEFCGCVFLKFFEISLSYLFVTWDRRRVLSVSNRLKHIKSISCPVSSFHDSFLHWLLQNAINLFQHFHVRGGGSPKVRQCRGDFRDRAPRECPLLIFARPEMLQKF